MKKTSLLRKLIEEKTVIAFGVYDAFSAMLVQKAGFEAAYLSGYLTAATFLGQPDLGLMSSTERLDIARRVTRRVDIPVIADAEEGYGNAIHVMDTVEQFESAGVAGIHLDDEAIPSKDQFFGTIRPNPLISIEEMSNKIRAAVDARTDPDFLIMARSDVFGTVTPGGVSREKLLEEIIERANAYARAGADMIFVYGSSHDELELYVKSIKAPLAGVLGYVAPLQMRDFEDLGYKLVICPLPILSVAAKAIGSSLQAFSQDPRWETLLHSMISQDELRAILKLEKYAELYKKYEA